MVTPQKKPIQSGNLLPYESNNFQTRIEGLTGLIQIILTASKMIGNRQKDTINIKGIPWQFG